MSKWQQELDQMTLIELNDFIFAYDQYFKLGKHSLFPSEYFYTIYNRRK